MDPEDSSITATCPFLSITFGGLFLAVSAYLIKGLLLMPVGISVSNGLVKNSLTTPSFRICSSVLRYFSSSKIFCLASELLNVCVSVKLI